MISQFFAAIQQAPGSAPATEPSADPAELIRDIVAPVSVPMPWWQQALIALAALAVLALLVWAVRKFLPKKALMPPPTPRAIALRDLQQLRGSLQTMEPYAFSISVSDVLRTYIGAQYRLPAREQTSPEFLDEISRVHDITEDDRRLLRDFLERADLIKFARVDADEQVSESLLSAAVAFVQGGRA